MEGPITLLLVVSLTGGEVQLAQLRATLEAQLDRRQVQLLVRRADGVPALDAALEAAARQGPVAVVTNPKKGVLEIRVALEPDHWISRTFRFAPSDPLRERNRTVALAIASMSPEWRLQDPLPEAEPRPDADADPTPDVPLLGPSDRPGRAPPDAGEAEPAPEASADAGSPDAGPAIVIAEPPRPPPPPDAQGVQAAAAALGETWPAGLGVQAEVRYCVGRWCAGVLARGQQADLPAAGASVLRGGLALAGRGQWPLWDDRLGLAAHASLGAGYVLARRGTQGQDRWQAEAELAPELWLRVAGPVALFARVGVALTSGPTPIFVNGAQVTELPFFAGRALVGICLIPRGSIDSSR